MKRKKGLKGWWKRFLDEAKVPVCGASLYEWRKFANEAPRYLVEKTLNSWSDSDCPDLYWADVLKILYSRCEKFEKPFLKADFITAHQDRIFWVPDGCGNEEVSARVWAELSEYPAFVVEKCGKFRGIAVFKGLVLAGTVNIPFCPSGEHRIQRLNMTKPLCRADILFVADKFAEIKDMMEAVEVPVVDGIYWLTDCGRGECAWDSRGLPLYIYPQAVSRACVIGKL